MEHKDAVQDWGCALTGFGGLPTNPFPLGQPSPPDPPSVPTLTSLAVEHEKTIEDILSGMSQVRKLILYRQLYAQGMRIGGIESEIHSELKKELKSA